MTNCHGKNCCQTHAPQSAVAETVDELTWKRGIWGGAQSGDLSRCQMILEKRGAAADDRDSAGYTALHYAARAGKIDLCMLLLRYGADPNAQTYGCLATPLHRAAYMGHDDICCFLVEKGGNVLEQDADGMTPLHKAAQRSHATTVRLFLRLGADPTIRDKRQKRPVDYASTDLTLDALHRHKSFESI